MWLVDNRTPFAAERGWVRDRDGTEVWLVAVKCTFDIHPDGTTTVADEQPSVFRLPQYNGEPGRSSVKYDGDLVLTKTTTDVIVVGHAYAPNGRPVTQMEAGFSVDSVQKVLRVTGDRIWTDSGPSSAAPFLKMPLLYERAFGGVDRRSARPERDWDWRNPVGTGFAIDRDHLNGVPLPNIEYPEEPVRSWKDRPRPAGLGPIEGHWQPRAILAGTYDERWQKERQPLLPIDFDDRFFQSAPADQQARAFLKGGESVTLFHLTPAAELRFIVPRVYLGFETLFYDGSSHTHTERRLHTLIIEPDYPRVSLVWHSAFPCHFKVQKLQRTVVTMKDVLGRTDDTPAVEALERDEN